MKRSDLEKRAINLLEEQGYTCERAYNKAVFIPGKGYVGMRFDFFHVIDIIAIKSSEIRFIQVTSQNANHDSKHHSRNGSDSEYDHMKKIEKYWSFAIPIELWTYEKIHNKWELRVQSYAQGIWYQGIIANVIKNPVTGSYYPIRAHQEVMK
jgi:hypothetical protein